MAQIALLDQDTINKIAAGEVIERPSSVVKELLENAIDAKATAITVEIKDGGISFIRITDNGCGIDKEQVKVAFLRHSTSKIRTAEDLITVSSLGFRGEALSSIAAVSQVELITKTAEALTGVRYQIEGGIEKGLEEIGAPEGTTFIVRNLFYNTPARRKFLKTAAAEGSYINILVERLALSRPDISIRFIQNNQNKLHSSGNHNLKDLIYMIYGRDIAANLIPIEAECAWIKVSGFIGNPVIARGNRTYENYFINGRYIRSNLIGKAIEEGYQSRMMQHKYPFTVLHLTVEPEFLDVNVHPAKMELRFRKQEEIFAFLSQVIRDALTGRELIRRVSLGEEKQEEKRAVNSQRMPEPFEKNRLALTKDRRGTEKEQHSRQTLYSEKDNGGEKRSEKKTDKDYQAADFLHTEFTADERQKVGTGETERSNKEKNEPGRCEEPLGNRQAGSGREIRENNQAERCEGRKRSDQTEEYRGTEKNCVGGMKEKSERNRESAAKEEQSNDKNLGGVRENVPLQIREENPYRLKPDRRADASSSFLSSILPETEYNQPVQMDLFEEKILTKSASTEYQFIGQLFNTYWLIQYRDTFLMIDQHAAHEKVLYERLMASMKSREYTSQMLNPPIILTLSSQEEVLLQTHLNKFRQIGFEIEHFGGKEYAVYSVPDNLFSLAKRELLMEMLDSLFEGTGRISDEIILEKIASMSCKAAVKGNQSLSVPEAKNLIDELMGLENPYTCPHGRPTIISMSRYEIEKKFKRIV